MQVKRWGVVTISDKGAARRVWFLALIFLGVWLGLRYLFPLFLPFLLGWGLAAMAEPGVKFLQKKLRFPRFAASGAAVSATLTLLLGLLWLLAALSWRELSGLARGLPGLVTELTAGLTLLRGRVLSFVGRAPDALAAPLEQMISELFTGGSILIETATDTLLRFAAHLFEGIPGGALLAGTAVISGYMISGQYPALAARIGSSSLWEDRLQPALARLRTVAGRWLRAQLRLSGVTFGIVWIGYLILGVENSLILALITAVVDAVPMLGTGTLLIPWSLVKLLQGQTARGIGLLGVYMTAMITRSSLEPKLVGRQLGMNPLLTLMALYAGFRLWGVAGMILAPILTVLARELARGD